jgi:hypothetical protein
MIARLAREFGGIHKEFTAKQVMEHIGVKKGPRYQPNVQQVLHILDSTLKDEFVLVRKSRDGRIYTKRS